MKKPLTGEELARIRGRAEAATPGPWVTRPVSELWDGDYEGSNGCNLWLATEWKGAKGPNLGADEMLNQDAEFTAHARTDIPRLLDELAAARKENERLRLLVSHLLPSAEWELKQWGEGNNFDPMSQYADEAWRTQEALIAEARAALHSATEDADDRTT